jgi:hypothetical protein
MPGIPKGTRAFLFLKLSGHQIMLKTLQAKVKATAEIAMIVSMILL